MKTGYGFFKMYLGLVLNNINRCRNEILIGGRTRMERNG